MRIEIFGTTCAKCHDLIDTTEAVLAKLGYSDAQIIRVEDPAMLIGRCIWRAPALAIDGKVVVRGRVPSADELSTLFVAAAKPQS